MGDWRVGEWLRHGGLVSEWVITSWGVVSGRVITSRGTGEWESNYVTGEWWVIMSRESGEWVIWLQHGGEVGGWVITSRGSGGWVSDDVMVEVSEKWRDKFQNGMEVIDYKAHGFLSTWSEVIFSYLIVTMCYYNLYIWIYVISVNVYLYCIYK